MTSSFLLAASGLFFVLTTSGALGSVTGPCDLAEALEKLGAPKDQISTWVCIARFESDYNTSAVGPPNWDGSRDHGIFQINDRYWCSPPGLACGVDCRSLEDDDIADDWRCVKRIYKAHKLQQGNGFQAWAVYGAHCSGDTSSYTAACAIPVVLSWPHFMKASDLYLDAIEGLHPNSEKHESYIALEPTTGVPLEAHKRIQINIQVKGTPALKMSGNARDTMFPVLWLDESLELLSAPISLLKDSFLTLLKVVSIVRWVLIGIGILMILVGGIMAYVSAKNEHKHPD